MHVDRIPRGQGRLFTFGCSFTRHIWPTWADVMAHEFDLKLYNFGEAGRGNQYIFNQIMQADAVYGFGPTDTVMVCWTNVCREDRYANRHWESTGNIFTNNSAMHDSAWIREWADPYGMALRDLGLIHGAHGVLDARGPNWISLAMCDVLDRYDQWSVSQHAVPGGQGLADVFGDTVSRISASFYEVLWHNDIEHKRDRDSELVHENYIDGHPTPKEHQTYLERVLGYAFSDRTRQQVDHCQQQWLDFMRERAGQANGYFNPFLMSPEEKHKLWQLTEFWTHENLQRI